MSNIGTDALAVVCMPLSYEVSIKRPDTLVCRLVCPKIARILREYLASDGWVTFESLCGYGVGRVAISRLVVGLLPVALAVPEIARLIGLPEGVVLAPYAVPESAMIFARRSGTAREPAEAREEVDTTVEVGKLACGTASGHGGGVFGSLPAVVLVQHWFWLRSLCLGLLYLLCGVVGLIGGKARDIGIELRAQHVIVAIIEHLSDTLPKVVGILSEEFGADGCLLADSVDDGGILLLAQGIVGARVEKTVYDDAQRCIGMLQV